MKSYICPVCFDVVSAPSDDAGGPFCRKCLLRRLQRVRMAEFTVVKD